MTRLSGGRMRGLLGVLHQVGTVMREQGRWRSGGLDVLAAVDAACDTSGYLQRRIMTYRAEGVRWRWWQAELHWLRLPRRAKRRRPVAMTALFAPPDAGPAPYPAYPRTLDGDPDHRGALHYVLAGAVVDHRAAA